jgi:transaldolase
MKIYLDTANIAQLEEALSWGVLDGATTNPSLVAKEGRDYHTAVVEVCNLLAPLPVSVEVLHDTYDEILADAHEMYSWADNVVVKVATTAEGLRAISALREENIPVNATLIFSVNQAMLAIKAGARYVSPFIGRLDDIGHDGVAITGEIVGFLSAYAEYDCEVIAASLRHPRHCIEVAQVGAHIATMPHAVLKQMIQHPLTDAGLAKFLSDWRATESRIKG